MNRLRLAALSGLRNSLRLRMALPLYLTSLAIGLVQTWPLFFGVTSGRTAGFDFERLLTDGDALVQLLTQQETIGMVAGWLLLLPLLSALYGLAYNLFSGGVLSVWNESRGFWAGCKRFFFPFTGLGMLLVIVAVIILSIATAIGAATASVTAVGIVTAIVLQLLNLVGEYARAIGVVRDRRNPFVLFGAAAQFCARNPGALLFGLVGLLLHAALAAAYLALLRLVGASPLSILVDQALVLAWLWVKLLRLAWARAYVASAQHASPQTTLVPAPEAV